MPNIDAVAHLSKEYEWSWAKDMSIKEGILILYDNHSPRHIQHLLHLPVFFAESEGKYTYIHYTISNWVNVDFR